MKITYLAHSGFLVELEHALLLFDYYKGVIPALPPEKMLYVFVSHRHEDHFNPEVFQLVHPVEHTYYILAYDLKLTGRNLERWKVSPERRAQILSARYDEEYALPGEARVETLKSTDEGVAFLVTIEGRTIFHAGDLNWWYWAGETTAWNKNMTAAFTRAVDKIAGRNIEVAFLPLDDRQGADYYRGMDYYLRNVKINYAFPMHFWEDHSVIRRFEERPERKDYATVILDTAQEHQWNDFGKERVHGAE